MNSERRRRMAVGPGLSLLVVLLALASAPVRPVLGDATAGSLRIESEPPGASVYVDGRSVGDTPVTVAAVVGVHRVRIIRLGYLENSRLVTVKTGELATVRVHLTEPKPQSPNSPALKIVVLEGEGAVNVIQQKTVVAPLVEVRDRNDQPVAGAVVNFTIRRGRATFAGARTLTVTTDAAGRAAAGGLAPSGSGALQIGATATFQGQTAAAVTIAQTNAMTVAEAAAASSASPGTTSGASGGGGGGGMSTTMLAVVGGAAVAGGVVAKKFLFGPTVFRGQFPADLTLTFNSRTGGPGCTRLERYPDLGMTIRLNETEGNLSGTSAIYGDRFVTGGTCTGISIGQDGGIRTGQIGRVTGSPENLVVTLTETGPLIDGSGDNQDDFTFTGVLSGDEIRGVLNLVRRFTFRSGNSSSGVGTNNYNIVLRKE